MPSIESVDGGFLIEEKLLFGADFPDGKYINLSTEPGEDMRYVKHDHQLIDFPGEYNIDGISFRVYLGQNKKLNYIIELEDFKIGIIQSPNVLEEGEISSQDVWLYQDDSVGNKLDQLELEGEKKKLENLDN